MKQFGSFFVLLIMIVSPALAFDQQTETRLKRLDPETRLVQACDLEAMERIDHDPNRFHPDHVIIDQLSRPDRNGNMLQGAGGVFRSGGKWYHLSFKCKLTDDHLTVLSFSYKIGDMIERSEWGALNLFP